MTPTRKAQPSCRRSAAPAAGGSQRFWAPETPTTPSIFTSTSSSTGRARTTASASDATGRPCIEHGPALLRAAANALDLSDCLLISSLRNARHGKAAQVLRLGIRGRWAQRRRKEPAVPLSDRSARRRAAPCETTQRIGDCAPPAPGRGAGGPCQNPYRLSLRTAAAHLREILSRDRPRLRARLFERAGSRGPPGKRSRYNGRARLGERRQGRRHSVWLRLLGGGRRRARRRRRLQGGGQPRHAPL